MSLVLVQLILANFYWSSLADLGGNGSDVASQGGALWCYECAESYSSIYDPLQAPCRNNLSAITLRRCSPEHQYCMVQRSSQYGWTAKSISRGCSDTCFFGCRFNGFSISDVVCTSCCRRDACNVGDTAPALGRKYSRPLVLILLSTNVFLFS